MARSDYYANECLEALKNHDTTYAISIKLYGTSGASKHLNINADSIDVIVAALREAAKFGGK